MTPPWAMTRLMLTRARPDSYTDRERCNPELSPLLPAQTVRINTPASYLDLMRER